MKALRILIMTAVFATGFALMPAQSMVSAECLFLSGNGDTDLILGPFSLDAGSTITVNMTAGEGGLGDRTTVAEAVQPTYAGTLIEIHVDGVQVQFSIQYVASHTVSYTLPAASSNVLVRLDWENNGDPANTYTVTSSGCDLGCNAIMPPQAVVGTFTQDVAISWQPGSPVSPPVVIEAGKTYYVAGQDASGEYLKVLLGCEWVWVPAGSVGPNYDEVWNGTPLPTTIVD